MPIPVPNLDDRGFDQLVEDLVRRIGAHTPEWTDPVPGDPGRTLIDLFAHLGEQLLYRANLIPERQRLAFLRLLDLPLRPAVPATGLLRLQHPGDTPAPITVAPGSRVAGDPPFETRDECRVLPYELRVFAKRPTTDQERLELDEVLAGLRSHLAPEIEAGELPSYITTPLFSDGRATVVDPATDCLDHALWLALLVPASRDPSSAGAATADEHEPQVLNLGLALARDAALDSHGLAAADLVATRFSVEATGSRMLDPTRATYRGCELLVDGTEGLNRDGVLRVILPERSRIGVPQPPTDSELYAGVGDTPPRIDDPELAARLVGWLRLRGVDGDRLPPLRWLGGNAVAIEQLHSTRHAVVVGQGSGASDLQLRLPEGDVLVAGLAVEVEESGRGFVPWTPVAVLAHAGPEDRAYELDAAGGVLRFGDGRSGKIPARGARVRLRGYRAGGGQRGNLPPASLRALELPGRRLLAEQPLPTTGGRDRESLAQAERRVGDLLRHGHRAVTAADYQSLALQTPGARLGRVEVLPRFQPRDRIEDVPGTVSVMVLPVSDLARGVVPRPDRATAERVYRHLDALRPVGTALHVIAPEYRPVAVGVAVEPGDPQQRDRILLQLRLALRQHCWPLAPGGRDGRGWGLGEALLEQELMVVAARVPGIRLVHDLALFQRGEDGAWQRAATNAEGKRRVTMARWQLPELLAVIAVDGDTAPDATAIARHLGEASEASALLGLAVPVVPDTCRPCGCADGATD